MINKQNLCNELVNILKKKIDNKIGLVNLGNTCYMNSCIQALHQIQQLTSYFLKEETLKQIEQIIRNYQFSGNYDKGKVSLAFSKCTKQLIVGTQPFSPFQLKDAMGSIKNQYQTFQQQDASQFCSDLLLNISQDLNSVKSHKKPFKTIHLQQKSDEEGAKICWAEHMKFNQSIITDLMTGIFKSVIICSKCNKQSKKFDQFTTINLPIPTIINKLKITVLYANFRRPTIQFQIQFRQANLQQLKKQAVQIIKEKTQNFKFYFLTKNRKIQDIQKLSLSQFKQLYPLQRAFLLQLNPEQKNQKFPYALSVMFTEQNKNKATNIKNLWLKRPFFINLSQQTTITLKKKILRYLYNTVYKHSEIKTFFGLEGRSYLQYQNLMLSDQTNIQLQIAQCKNRQDLIPQVFYQQIIYLPNSKQQLSKSINLRLFLKKKLNLSQKLQQLQLFVTFNEQTFKQFEFSRLDNKICLNQQNSKNQNQQKNIGLYQCLNSFQSEQTINQWFCQNCEQKLSHKKSMSIYKSPDILILVLSRFKQDSTGKKLKHTMFIDFQLQLNLEKYVLDKKPIYTFVQYASKNNKDYKKPSYDYKYRIDQQTQKFQLFAIVNHYGSLNAGHYYTYAKSGDCWYEFNDKKVQKITDLQKLKTPQAYMLFYRKKYKKQDIKNQNA